MKTLYSQEFKVFWKTIILNDSISSIDESDMDPIIRRIDYKGKGNTKESISAALALIRQGQWYRAFRSIKENKEIKNIINKLFSLNNDDELIKYLNDLEKINSRQGNGITSKNAIILNGLLFINNPNYYISSLSLDHRNKIINYLYSEEKRYETFGEKVIKTNRVILDYFKNQNIVASPRTISNFIYKKIWNFCNNDSEIENEEIEINEEKFFILEKYLEDFLIGNWDATELGKNYSLIYGDDEDLISQQYKTDIGRIDLLVNEKTSNNYVVIELKRNQTSDDTVGQLLRYMGWVKEKLANNGLVKGIIIGYSKDDKLSYAIKAVPNVELLYYRINFSLVTPK